MSFCSVEDPFETWYDVAHVIKSVQMERTRAEFAVSANFSCICANIAF